MSQAPTVPPASGVRRVGKYEVGRTLGEGTFAKVKYAINTETGESVAVKVLDKEKILQHKMVDQIKREISIMKLVRHPNVVRLHEVLASRTKIYIVLEFVTGGELFDQIVHQGRIPEEQARRYFQQLIDAVEFCHSKGVYHRDLKPENLLLDTQGCLKISDFGLSALPQQVRSDGLLHTTCGTPNYVAPEVLNDRGYDGAMSDLWSCGVILYVLMAGFLPFDEQDIHSLYRKIQRAEYRCPPWFSSGAIRLLSKILNPDPNRRYTYDQIRKDPWFQEGYIPVRPLREDGGSNLADIDAVFAGGMESEISEEKHGEGGARARPETMNAFELITLSQGLDLGVLFQSRQHMVNRTTRFASRKQPEEIVTRLKTAAKELQFSVHVKNFKVKLDADARQGGNAYGGLSVAIEVFEITPGLHMVEVWKTGGDVFKFYQFYRSFLPKVKDLVWKAESDLEQMRLTRKVLLSPHPKGASSSSAAAEPRRRSLSSWRLPGLGT